MLLVTQMVQHWLVKKGAVVPVEGGGGRGVRVWVDGTRTREGPGRVIEKELRLITPMMEMRKK